MLYIPNSEMREVSIVGVDPGTNTLGCAVLGLDIDTLNITSIYTHTYVGEWMPMSDTLIAHHGDRYARLYAIQNALTSLFDSVNPLYIGCEAPFINVRRPQAYGALVQAVDRVQQASINHKPYVQFRLVEPLRVKMAVGAKFTSDKTAVWNAMCGIPEIINCLGPFQPDEHSVDAIAVAYYIVKQLRVNPVY